MDYDEWCFLHCGDCIYSGRKCKRIGGTNISFYKPWFAVASYGRPCRDFSPIPDWKWLYEHWDGFDDYYSQAEDYYKRDVCLVLDNNFDILYRVRWEDWINNTFLDDNGELKWIKKSYYKRTREGLGFKLVHEYREIE